MSTKTLSGAVETSGLGYRGFQVPALRIERSLRKDIGTNKKAYQLTGSRSTTTTVWLNFYHIGRDLALYGQNGSELPEDLKSLPEADKEIGRLVYSDCQARAKGEKPWKGLWFDDVLNYDAKKPIGTVVPEGYIFAELVQGIEGWEVDEGKGLFVPQGGIKIPVEIPVSSGAFALGYDGFTGMPKRVEPDEAKAIKALRDSGLTEEQAKSELSRVYTTNSGLAVVGSGASRGGGPLSLSLSAGPGYGDRDVGSVAASRLASGGKMRIVANCDSIVTNTKKLVGRVEELLERRDRFDRELGKIIISLEEVQKRMLKRY